MRRQPHDPLKHRLARRRIDQSQFAAGQKYRQLSAIAERNPEALEALARCRVELGDAGIALLDATLLAGLTTKQVADQWGLAGAAWESYYARRLDLCLGELAIVFGFVSSRRPAVTSAPAPL